MHVDADITLKVKLYLVMMIFMNALLKAVNTKNTGVVITTLSATTNSKQNKIGHVKAGT